MDWTKFCEEFNIQKHMEITFKISNEYHFDLEKMIDIFCKIIDTLDLTYNYEYAVFDKSYWENGFDKHDELLKHIGSLSNISKEELMKIKDECNGFFWEAKYKRKPVMHISFSLIDMNNYQNHDNFYNISIERKGEIYEREVIMELARIVKEGIHAKDEIIIGKNPKYELVGGETVQIDFSQF